MTLRGSKTYYSSSQLSEVHPVKKAGGRGQRAEGSDQGTGSRKIELRSGGLIDKESIENLRCSLLIEINRLWDRYSSQKFGFNIQKNIYLNYLKESDNRIKYNEEAFNKFGDHVGWRENGKWKTWEELTEYSDKAIAP